MIFFNTERFDKKDIILVIILFFATVVLLIIPHGFEREEADNTERVRALVLETDNSDVKQYGIVKQGDQDILVRLLSGRSDGRELRAKHGLIGKMDLDTLFAPGDTALAVVHYGPEGEEIINVNLVDKYRIHVELILFILFALLLLFFAGWTGAKALLSFAFSAAAIWKLMLPAFLYGINPVLVSLGIVSVLTAAIIFLIGGVRVRGLAAFFGSMSGILLTCLFSLLFGKAFGIHGAVKQFSETLLYSGFPHLDLTQIFLAGIFLASSGAVMDIAIDIAASMKEVYDKHPLISRFDLIKSGFAVGRAVIGTMTTTLLLAYSGGYASMLMVFMAQGTPGGNILNLNYVAAEILHTLVGSFGLVLVAPATAVIAGFLYTRKRTDPQIRQAAVSEIMSNDNAFADAAAAAEEPAVGR